jgi:hypothetical protein
MPIVVWRGGTATGTRGRTRCSRTRRRTLPHHRSTPAVAAQLPVAALLAVDGLADRDRPVAADQGAVRPVAQDRGPVGRVDRAAGEGGPDLVAVAVRHPLVEQAAERGGEDQHPGQRGSQGQAGEDRDPAAQRQADRDVDGADHQADPEPTVEREYDREDRGEHHGVAAEPAQPAAEHHPADDEPDQQDGHVLAPGVRVLERGGRPGRPPALETSCTWATRRASAGDEGLVGGAARQHVPSGDELQVRHEQPTYPPITVTRPGSRRGAASSAGAAPAR